MLVIRELTMPAGAGRSGIGSARMPRLRGMAWTALPSMDMPLRLAVSTWQVSWRLVHTIILRPMPHGSPIWTGATRPSTKKMRASVPLAFISKWSLVRSGMPSSKLAPCRQCSFITPFTNRSRAQTYWMRCLARPIHIDTIPHRKARSQQKS
jgi:hypothetical protein